MNLHYKAIKLKTGELMACSCETDITTNTLVNNKFVTLHNPVLFNSFKFLDQDGELVETISMMPLIPVSESTIYDISTDAIMVVSNLRGPAVNRYNDFVVHIAEQRAAEDKEDEEDLLAMQEEAEVMDDNVVDITKFSTKILH